ncbi:MAG TPA: hypothetical protein VII44_09270 [Puia sp.]
MFKRVFFHGMMASVLSAISAIIYKRIYFFANEADFSKVLDLRRLIGLSLLICLVAALLNYGLNRWLKKKGDIIFNFLFSILSFASVVIPISFTLPLNVQFPELFPGLAVPMVFFPAIAWYTVNPLFIHNPKS